MTKACESWIALSDRAATGSELKPDDVAFLETHASTCSACGVEASVWGALEQSLGDPTRLTAFPQPAQSVARVAKGRARSWLVAALAAALLGVTSLMFLKRGSLLGTPPRTLVAAVPAAASATSVPAGARLVLVSGAVHVNGGPAVAGQSLSVSDTLQIEAGTACLLVPPGVTVCAEAPMELAIAGLSPKERRLKLTRGRVLARLDRQPADSSFGFETGAGSVVAKGTVFSIEAWGDDVRLRVQEGTVVSSSGSEMQSFVGPAAALLSATRNVSRIAFEADASDVRLLQLSKLFTDRAGGELEVTAISSGDVKLDEARLGSTPLSALVMPGSYRLLFERTGTSPVTERIVVQSGERTIRRYEIPPRASASAEPQGNAVAERVGTLTPLGAAGPATLLAEARQLRTAGRYVAAGATYRRLFREYSGSGEARAAMVSFGELQLSQLGDAAGALRSFETYLRSAGSLSQEASYGKIRALRALGRRAEEQAATTAFLAAYPRSVQAARLRNGSP